MVMPGDQLYIGRYLVTGADAASLYLEVKSKTDTEITCVALNDAELGGLLTIFHMERNVAGILNKQNQQPLFSPGDSEAIEVLSKEFDVDFLSLSYCRTAQARAAPRWARCLLQLLRQASLPEYEEKACCLYLFAMWS
jgi:pyruvate kinase